MKWCHVISKFDDKKVLQLHYGFCPELFEKLTYNHGTDFR